MSIGRIVVDLLARTGSFETDLNRSAKLAAKRAKEIDAAFAKAGKAIGTALGVAAGAGIAALVAGTKTAIDQADRLNDISQRLGVGTEALSAWGYAAQQSGTDIESLNTGLTRFTRNVAAAMDPTSKQGELFAALGVKVKDAQGKLRSVESLVPEVAEAFKNLNNATLESALAQELFGRSGTNLLQFLNLGAGGLSEMEQRARDLGIVISQETASAADEFNDTLADLKAVTSGLFTQIAADLMPALTDLVRRFADLVKNGELANNIVSVLSTTFKVGAGILETYVGLVNRVSIAFELLAESAAGYYEVQKNIYTLGLADGSVAGGLGRMSQAYKEGQAQIDGLRDSESPDSKARADISRQISDAGRPLEHRFTAKGREEAAEAARQAKAREEALNRLLSTGGGSKKGGKSDAEREAEQLKAAYDRMNESLAQQIALFGQDGEAARVRYEVEHGELQKLSQAQKDQLIAQAERLDVMREEAEVQKELDDLNKRREKAAEQVLADIALENELLGKTIEQQDTLNKLRYAGVTANSAWGQSIIAANQALHENAQATERQVELMDTFRTEASSAIQDVVNGTKSLKDAFTDMFDSIAERITQMIAERWIEQMFGQMGSTNTGSSGGWISAFFSLFSGGRASGGPVMDGGSYLVGERGPELFMPRTAGMVIPAAQTSRMLGGGGTVNQTFVVQGNPDRRTREQMARMSGREAARGIARTGR